MKYKNSYKTTVDFLPWFDTGYRFQSLHLYEELGGEVARGEMRLEVNGEQNALELITKQNTGTIKLEQEGGLIFEIPIFIIHRSHEKNFLDISFVCLIDDQFITDVHQTTWDNLEDMIDSIFPGKVQRRCETDIQAKNIKYYQNNETDQEFLKRICLGYKKNSIFAFGLEGLVLKETMGKYDSRGDEEPSIELHVDSDGVEQESPYQKEYKQDLYEPVVDIWSNKELAGKDYSTLLPVNPRVTYKNGDLNIVHKDYMQLMENLNYNVSYLYSNMFQEVVITDRKIPNYKIGDVVTYVRDSKTTPNSKLWPFKYYLVKSNEFFIAADDSSLVADDGYQTKWTTKLIGLEENGKIALGTEDNPTRK